MNLYFFFKNLGNIINKIPDFKNATTLSLAKITKSFYFQYLKISGHSSVVERLVANEKVEGSTPFARSKKNYE